MCVCVCCGVCVCVCVPQSVVCGLQLKKNAFFLSYLVPRIQNSYHMDAYNCFRTFCKTVSRGPRKSQDHTLQKI